MKRKWSTTTKVDAVLEHSKYKRARICAAASQDEFEVVEVSRFIDCSLLLAVSIF